MPVVTALHASARARRPCSPPTPATTARPTCATWPSSTSTRSSPTTPCASGTSASRRRTQHQTTPASPVRQDGGARRATRLPAERLHLRRRGAHLRVSRRARRSYRSGRDLITRGYVADHFRGAKRVCGPCPLRTQCLRTPDRTPTRQVAFFHGKAADTPETHTARMKRRLDTPEGRAQYGRRFATVEPVFGNLRANKRLDRFTLRGPHEGRRAMEAVLPGAQHRETRPSRLRRPGRSLTTIPGGRRA